MNAIADRAFRYLLLAALMLLADCAPEQENIVNPVPGYNQLPRQSQQQLRDSVLAVEVLFEQLPQFGETTPILVTYYSQFDSQAGVEIAVQNANLTRFEISPFVAVIPGPIMRGDTVQALFEFKPRAVGYLHLKFIVYDPTYKNVKTPVRVGGWVMPEMILSPSGETVALASPAAKGNNHVALGPNPELLDKGLVYTIDPKLPSELRPPNYEEHLEERAHRYWYDVRLEVFAGSGSGSIEMHGTLSPYHAFAAGIGYEVSHGDNIEITNISPSIVGPVIKHGTYDFEIDLRSRGRAVIENLSICFVTPNPDLGIESGVFSHKKSRELKRCFSFCIGFDDSGDLLFVAESRDWSFLGQRSQDAPKPLFNDNRIDWAYESGRLQGTSKKTYSDNYEDVMLMNPTDP